MRPEYQKQTTDSEEASGHSSWHTHSSKLGLFLHGISTPLNYGVTLMFSIGVGVGRGKLIHAQHKGVQSSIQKVFV